MEEKRALINSVSGLVLNIVIYDSINNWTVPSGTELLSASDSIRVSIGDVWDGIKIIKQIAPTPEVIIDTTPIVNFGDSVLTAVKTNKPSWTSLSSADKIKTIGKILGLE